MKILAIPIFFIICVILVLFIIINTRISTDMQERMAEELASELGVRISDYPYEKSFPVGYFYTVLKPGMTIEEVHKIVRSYKQVLRCKSYSEIYYYYGSELDDTVRFKIHFDEQGGFERLEGEDTNSRYLRTEDCEPGLINSE